MELFALGHTRGRRGRDHLLQTPDTFVRSAFPGMRKAVAIVHASPALGAEFTQYTLEMKPQGSLEPWPAQRFLFVLEGAVQLGGENLQAGGYAYCPSDHPELQEAAAAARVLVIEKIYSSGDDREEPEMLAAAEDTVERRPFLGDPDVQVQTLLPDDFSFDFAVNIMSFRPGASLPMTEVHVMEHGLFVLEGSGIYRLNESWYPVTAGDFIWMAPHCPQWFAAIGKVPARYLIYKDWNRSPL